MHKYIRGDELMSSRSGKENGGKRKTHPKKLRQK